MNKDHRDLHLIFFGRKEESLLLSDIKELRFSLTLQNLAHDHGLQKFVVLDQVHGTDGVIVDEQFFLRSGSRIKSKMIDGDASWFKYQADFLITSQKNIGLVVLTADCVPLVLYDPKHHAIGLVHAGWKGAYLGVLQEALQAMQKTYDTQFSDLKCSFGASSRGCCYEVSESLIDDFKAKYSDFEQFQERGLKYYFDNSLFLQQFLKKFGIPPENIYTKNALCTICNPEFCSFRKEKELARRQVTIVALL